MPQQHRAAGTVTAGGRTHVVRPGESLWSITAQHLGPHSKISDIAAAWPRLFELNRAIIGSNPRLVLPGQRLALPTNFDQASS
jgi:nucleoid-associated protein YgaU